MAEEKTSDVPQPKVMTLEMVRKRSEHNDGILSTMEEIAMHQDEIGKITKVLEINCPKLRIVYLQNNYISKIENLDRLHSLEYLNLALNNITVIENLEGCEKLNKLDLTCNFIVNIRCIKVLQKNTMLKELHLIGNPCDKFEGYRNYVIATLPTLKNLDGQEITPTERILAAREYQEQDEKMKKQIAEYVPTNYTPEERLEAWRDIEMTKRKNTTPETKDPRDEYDEIVKPKAPPAGPDEHGKIIQCNTGKWNFRWKEDAKILTLDVALNRYLDISQITLDVNPTYIRLEAKGKVLQLITPVEVSLEDIEAQRSETSGHLVIKMKKANLDFTKK